MSPENLSIAGMSIVNILSKLDKPSDLKNETNSIKSFEERLEQEKLDQLKTDGEQRKKFGIRIFWFVCIYMIAIFAILFFSGFELCGFKLSDAILITILTTTLVNVFGLFIFVLKYLYNIKVDKLGL